MPPQSSGLFYERRESIGMGGVGKKENRNILGAIQDIHEKDMIHGALDDASSYVMRGGNTMYLIFSSQLITPKDLQALKSFLTQQCQQPNTTNLDWKLFLKFFELDKASAKNLRNHPVLMTDKERFNYYVAIGHYMEKRLQSSVTSVRQTMNALTYPPCGMDWRYIIVNKTHANGKKFLGYDMMNFKFQNQVISACKYGSSLSELNMLITNFVKHSGKYLHQSLGNQKDYMEADAAMEIGYFFPGFLSELNEMFIQYLDVHNLLD
ncbi:uncharacterized protein LOC132269570 isoform X2 [Cornus florida]|uniref:uncharacterized protein LOC132269570 isoform X2 n=1 Tax=Cornus florida TaxID=4283 RepID=UPI002896747C|nr:uncharacterized protein LOC132269570 isoform X2 [Cornus florida]